MYLTINHLDDFNSVYRFRIGDKLTLKKETDNPYDDEAIAVYDHHKIKCGYVANSVHSVARGTYSAGRILDLLSQEEFCFVRFIFQDILIVEVLNKG